MAANRLTRVTALAILAVLGCGAAYYAGTRMVKPRMLPCPDPDHTERGPLAVAVTDLDLGAVWESSGHVVRLPVHNSSADTVHVADWRISCNCTSVTPRQLVIAPGETSSVELKIDLTHRLPSEMGLPERPFTVGIAPVLESKAARQPGWVVRGIVRSRVTLNEDFLQFGESPVHGQPPVRRRVAATLHVPAERLDICVNSEVVRVEVARRGERQFELTISPNPQLPPGVFRTDATIDLLTAAGKRLAGVTLPVAGTMQPAVRLLPARVFLGSHPIGQSSSAVVVMQVPDGVVAKVERIEAESSDVTVEAVEADGILPGRAYRITQKVREEGDRISKVLFLICTGDKPAAKVSVEILYRGEPRDWIGRAIGGVRP